MKERVKWQCGEYIALKIHFFSNSNDHISLYFYMKSICLVLIEVLIEKRLLEYPQHMLSQK